VPVSPPDPARHPTRRRPPFEALTAVAVGGGVGTLARYELSAAVPFHRGGFPWAVFTVNVVGAFALGVIATLASERGVPPRWLRPLLAVGFCGGLTTFSTWMVDAVRLGDDGRGGAAVLDVGATLTAGFLALLVGVWAARSWSWGRRIA